MLQEIEKFITETKKILSSQHNPKQNEQCWFQSILQNQVWWLTPKTPATLEADIGGLRSKACLGKRARPCLKN
jgi:hypothetical protein